MRRALPAVVLLGGLAAGVAPAFGADPGPAPYGRIVESIQYVSDGEVDAGEVGALIAIVAGRPLTEVETGATIRNLYGTRRYSNVAVDAEPLPDGELAVTVYLWRAYIVRTVEFDGKFAPTREDLRRVVPLSAGDPFNASALEAGAAALERRLAAEGYIAPTVEPEAVFDDREFTVTVVYRISAGKRARVTEPFFDGDTAPFSPAELAKRMRLGPGDVYREGKARDDAERLRKYLLSEGRFRASVELIAAEPTDDGRIRPVFRIAVGPLFELQVTGLKEKAARKQILALLELQPFDEDLLEQWSTDRRGELQRSGRYRATVSATADGTDPVVVRLAVEPGAKYAVESIEIAGDASVPEKTLRDLMVTRTKGLPLVATGHLTDEDLAGDVSTILGYYQTRGWVDARVTSKVTDGPEPGSLDVRIDVAEGPRAFVAERRVEGAEHLQPEDLAALLTVKVGAPFNPVDVRRDVAALTSRYRNTGWASATVQDKYTLSEDRTKVDVEYRVDEGERSFFGRTIIRGNAVTEVERIRKQIAWKEGEPFSEEKVADTQQNLARTGVFRSIDVRPQPANPETQTRTIDVEVAEARRLSLLYGFGYLYAAGADVNRNDVFGIAGLTYRNLFGRMQSASIEVQYAPISTRGYLFARFLDPYAFDSKVPISVVGFASRLPIQDVNVESYGGYVETVRPWGKYLRVGLRYEYQVQGPQNPQDLSTIEVERFPKTAFPIKQSAVGPSFFYDRRDDILDPHSGWYATLAGKYAFPFASADARYGKVSGQAAWFKSIFGGVLATSFKMGGIYPYGLGGYDVIPPEDRIPVPIAERFYSGGSSTGRGFATDLAGIPGATVDYNTQAVPKEGAVGTCAEQYPNQPNEGELALYDCTPGPRIIGGNGFMAWTLEYRFPILGNLGVSVFYDLAQVWARAGNINFRIEGDPNVPAQFRTGLRQSIGAGLHYMTPIGPLRLEYARPVQLRDIDYRVTATQNPDGTPCDPSPCVLVEKATTRETGRVFLSIGYPF